MQDCYDALHIDSDASDEEIKSAYKRLARCTHPDCEGGDEERFKEIQQAYEILSDPEKRKEHADKQTRKKQAPPRHSAKRPTAQLVLTKLESLRGGRVSLEIPVEEHCPVCLGRGRLLGFVCPYCLGDGKIQNYQSVELAYPPGIRDRQRFSLNLLPFGHAQTLEMEIVIE